MRVLNSKARANRVIFIVCAILVISTNFDTISAKTLVNRRPSLVSLFTRSRNLYSRDVAFFTHDESKKGVVVPSAECRMVNKHKYKDKCAFIHTNCDDEQVGLINYLAFYYCDFRKAKLIPFVLMAFWLATLFTTIGIAASDFFCVNLSTISAILGMSESMAGVTFLAFGNGSPDVFSTFAAMKVNSGSLAVGELIGAASFITAVVAGSMAIVRPFKVAKKSFVRDVLFFSASVCFGIFFLWDGKIRWWECIVMISFYVFYVIFVVLWHWYQKRARAKRRVEFTAREHYTDLGEEEVEEEEEDAGVTTITPATPRLILNTDFDTLQVTNNEYTDAHSDDESEDERDQFSALRSNMRLGRPSVARMKTPVTPIRPSLFGALEFRSVVQTFEKHGNFSGRPIHLRSYSDDPFFHPQPSASAPGTLNVPGEQSGARNDSDPPYGRPGRLSLAPPTSSQAGPRQGRLRAVSVNDALLNRLPINFRQQFSATPILEEAASGKASPTPSNTAPPLIDIQGPSTPQPQQLTFSNYALQAPSPNRFLAPPSPSGISPGNSGNVTPSDIGSPLLLPSLHEGSEDNSRPNSPPRYLESPSAMSSYSMQMPPIIQLPDSAYQSSIFCEEQGTSPLKWWPYAVLPPPEVLLNTLFPTLVGFWKKSVFQMILGMVATPAVFLLTITLPVVESPEHHDEEEDITKSPAIGNGGLSSPISTAVSENGVDNRTWEQDDLEKPRDWNRWLVAVQCITAPMFIILVLCAGEIPLLRPILFACLVGLIAMFLLMVFTSPDRPPKQRYYLCFVGFMVSIGWISTVANEVVGVLKAFGVILGISDAILGLTVFAVGNSLGDLVADITVARLGFPVMALSACFGGPMLNILLGVGISGLYMTLTTPSDRNGYVIEVSSTLMISAITLLGTLLFLLIAVPMNGWKMSKKIGWCLVSIWGISTVVNLVVEIVGVGKPVDSVFIGK